MRFINGQTMTEAARRYHQRRLAGEIQPLGLHELVRAYLNVCQVIAYVQAAA